MSVTNRTVILSLPGIEVEDVEYGVTAESASCPVVFTALQNVRVSGTVVGVAEVWVNVTVVAPCGSAV
ncbi:hypothetical protein GCM10027268_01790 [Brachybacterium huguangmaarense]